MNSQVLSADKFSQAAASLETFAGGLCREVPKSPFLFSPSLREAGLQDGVTIHRDLMESLRALESDPAVQYLVITLASPEADIGMGLKTADELFNRQGSGELFRDRLSCVLDVVLAQILQTEVAGGTDRIHPQGLRHLLSYFSEQVPPFLLVINPLLTIIAEKERFAIEERGRAARTLINNYDIETIFIFMTLEPGWQGPRKDLVFPWLITFQKVYRRLREILYNRKRDKLRVAESWFRRSLNQLRADGLLPERDYQTHLWVRELITAVSTADPEKAKKLGRSLVLSTNNEDILRAVDRFYRGEKSIRHPAETAPVYQLLHDIMQEYRTICSEQKATEEEIKDKFSVISRTRREMEELASIPSTRKEKTPVLGTMENHPLLTETERNLKQGNLHHLFEIWPIPAGSQEIFNSICGMKEQLTEDPDIQFNHLLFEQKILEFLMRLERLGIGVARDPRLPLITNAFQLNSFNLIQKGTYFGSTGCWQCPNQIPPAVICCTNPNAITNCVGHKVRHVFLRVFLGTGEFYESPFILDSTLRYERIDEEGLLDGLLIRPGLFLLNIPDEIGRRWREIQREQLSARLETRIFSRIAVENTGGGMAAGQS